MNTLTVAGSLAAPPFQPPDIDYGLLLPMLVVFTAGVLAVLVEAFAPREVRRSFQVGLSLLAVGAAFGLTLVQAASPQLPETGGILVAGGTVAVDRPTLFLQAVILLLSFVSLLLIAERRVGDGSFAAEAAAVPGSEEERQGILAGREHSEVYPLVLFAVLGMLLFPAANDLLTMFIALEVLSMPLYLLCGLARRRRLLSQEAAVKYFLLGAFSSAFFLFGIAMIYGYAGSVRLSAIADAAAAAGGGEVLLLLGIALIAVGLLFKIGAVPFHNWKPDVYQGAPTPITAFMASVTLVSAFGAMLRVFYVAFGAMAWDWRPMIWVVAILTMVVGAVVAVTQTNVKRLLAYSSVVHAGFILTALAATSAQGLGASLFYLAVYGFSTIGAFAIVTLVRDSQGEAVRLDQWRGLARRSPLLALSFALFLLGFAGIPLTSGFIAKFAVFEAALAAGGTPLVVVGVLSSAVTAFFYARIIVVMFFTGADEPAEEPGSGAAVAESAHAQEAAGGVSVRTRPAPAVTEAAPQVEVVKPGLLSQAVIAIGAAATLVLGVVPQPVLDLATQAAQHLFVR
ncbi:NADH-quinone oxidoreductase subunit NuoN [Allonocardiopsis opalescens]|uniref:NADH-quinone oxidoreductase subunit N n=1 Tax=Allonocardiopsis opalescens TaxID=1144618 RepID=A0A2T0Q7Z3_9ACTN|nr:NADH-quinone oxidoreductase subunit NuoN [Allonocardiopsis opalescens]PRX99926.1 NADH dehydrogenase subunit N [Allonocardiopsis opalescens]